MTTGTTRLVGAGRLSVEVPAEWPFLGWGRVTQSHVLVRSSWVVPAIGFPPPPPDATVVELVAEPPARPRPRRPVVHLSWKAVALAGHPAVVLRDDWRQGSDERSMIRLITEELGASLAIEGPSDVCRAVESSAAVIDDGLTAVPNPWIDRHGEAFGHVDRGEEYLQKLFARTGLVVQLAGRSSSPCLDVVECDPSPTSVVPVGSTVTVTVAPFED